MKDFNLVVICIFILSLNSNGQLIKGAAFLGGNFSFSSEKGTGPNAYDVQGVYILPVYGFAIKDNLVIGVDMLFLNNDNDVLLVENDIKQRVTGGGFFIRKYQRIAQTNFSAFVQAHFGCEFERLQQGYATVDKRETRAFSILLNAYPGVSYKISKTLQFETGFNGILGGRYFHRKTTVGTVNPTISKVTGYSLYGSLENMARFNLGFRLTIDKKDRQKN
jgi:hypothetical protein